MSGILAAIFKTAIVWLVGGIAGAVLAVTGTVVLNDAFNIIGRCEGLGCLHPTYTVIMPIGAIFGAILGTVLLTPLARK